MIEQMLRDELDRQADAFGLGPADPGRPIAAGRRLRRRRAITRSLSSGTFILIVALLLVVQVTGGQRPSPYFGPPNGRTSSVSDGGRISGYPDLVTQRVGKKWVSIEGFGWPLSGQSTVSDRNGRVNFPPINRTDAEVMCLPMLNQAAPAVPDALWHHTGNWIDTFPSRAGLVSTFEATWHERTFYASCTLPGDWSPRVRPDLRNLPSTHETDQIRTQCGYIGHVDMSAWSVSVAARTGQTLAALLTSADGHDARCVLSRDPVQRLAQVSARTDTDLSASLLLYGGEETGTLTFTGTATSATALSIKIDGRSHRIPVRRGSFAAVIRGNEVTSASLTTRAGDQQPVDVAPAICFTSIVTHNNGC